MGYCKECDVNIEGHQKYCPLCDQWLENVKEEVNPYPDIPLKFNRYKIERILWFVSIFLIIALLAVDYFILKEKGEVLQTIILTIATLWLSIIIIIRKRRNLAKSLLYLLVSLNIIALYSDYRFGWNGWSISFALPFSCIIVLIALIISLKYIRLTTNEGLLYIILASFLSTLPGILLLLDLTNSAVPSYLSALLGTTLLFFILVQKGGMILEEVKKRFKV